MMTLHCFVIARGPSAGCLQQPVRVNRGLCRSPAAIQGGTRGPGLLRSARNDEVIQTNVIMV